MIDYGRSTVAFLVISVLCEGRNSLEFSMLTRLPLHARIKSMLIVALSFSHVSALPPEYKPYD